MITITPWQFLEDQDLVLLKSPLSDETCYCSLLGAPGEVFSLHAYRGDDSYRYFRKMAAGRSISIGEFYASLRGVYVEFVGLSELTQPDRELAQTFEHPLKTESADLPRPSPGLSLLVHHRKRGCCSRRMHRGCARFMPRSLQRRRPGLLLTMPERTLNGVIQRSQAI